MIRRIVALLCALLFATALWPPATFAQSDQPGTITITVTDAATNQPVELARVLLDGPVITTEFSSKTGEVKFIDVPDGIYVARVVKRGYDSVTSTRFEVLEGRAVGVSVALASSSGGLKVIATVAVKSSATITTSSISDDSTQRKLSTDLLGALGKLSGVGITSSSDDSDATQTISLNGQDASQTQLSLDGIPLNAPGTAGNANAFSTDLYSGASVSTGPRAGGLAGGVSFRTIEPTLSWQGTDQVSMGSNGRYNYSFGETGTTGKFGIAVQATHRLSASLLDGAPFLDASGLDYTHDGDGTSTGGLLKLRYNLNDNQTLTGEYVGTVGTSDLVCTRLDGAVPCGYGPNNFSDMDSQLYALTDNLLLGDTSLQASVYGRSFKNERNQLQRFINGFPDPTGSVSNANSTGFSFSAMLPAKERHTLSIQGSDNVSSETTSPLTVSGIPFFTGSQQTSFGSVQLNDAIQSSTKLILNESLGLSHASNAPVSLLASTAFNWHPTQVDSFSGAYAIGGVAAHAGRSTILTDPTLLSFNCAGDIADGQAPGDQPGASSSISLNASYSHNWRGALVSASLYRQVQNDVVFPTQVNGTVIEAMGLLPANYLTIAQQVFDSPAGCGQPPGTPFGAQNLYFSTPVGNVRRVYEGGSGTVYATLGSLVVQGSYTINVAKALTDDPRIDNPFSYVISGSQQPNVPLHSGYLALDYKAPHSAVEFLADAAYTGPNNRNNLPAYTTFDAAINAHLTRGTLNFVASNITNRFGGIFASPANAVPLQTAGGTLVPTLARPLTPRTYALTYVVRFGQGVQQTADRAGSIGGGRGRGGRFGGPGGGLGGGQGQGGRAGGRGGFFSPLPTSPPNDPFAASSNTACTGQSQADAQTFLSAMKTYVAQIEAAKTAAGYPATMPAPNIPNVTVTYHGLGSTYALSIALKTTRPVPAPNATPTPVPTAGAGGVGRGNRGGGARFAIFTCMQVHIAQPDDVTKYKLYQPPNSIFFVPQLTFMPAVGLYFAPRQPQAGQESYRVYKLPTKAPTSPFALLPQTQCTADVKSTAAQVLGELQAHFTKGAPTPSWDIVAHQAKSGTWYELNPNDVGVLPTILYCGRVAAAQITDLAPLGLDGARPPALNYTPSLGLYVLRNNFGGPGGPGGTPSPAPSSSP
ncbi:MAG TPA: TonB-dependent receptor [Candidatus Baltobacteraceae bacterium]